MRHVSWVEVADELIFGGYGMQCEDRKDYIKRHLDRESRDYLTIILLRDIAESLRILRCSNFKEIPHLLRNIRTHTGRINPKRRPKK